MYLYHSGKSQNLLEWYKFADPGVTQVHFTCMRTGFSCFSMFLQTKQKINNVGEIAWELNSLRSGNFYREFRGISEVKYYLL